MERTFMQKWGWAVGLLVAIIIVGLIIGFSHRAQAPSETASSTSTVASGTEPLLVPGAAPATTTSKTPAVSITPVSQTYSNPNWSISFELHSDWNINAILDASRKLHQMQVNGSNFVIFISQNEAIGLSDDLKYATTTRTVAGQTVEERVYTNPSTQFAKYELFTIKESDATYSFLVKNVSTNTSATDAFLNAVTHK